MMLLVSRVCRRRNRDRGHRTVSAGLIAAMAVLGAVPAAAAEPSGCDKFKWPIERERAALTAPDRIKAAAGAELAIPAAATVDLKATTADLPAPPERKPKDGTFAGVARFAKAPKAGTYTISLSAEAWVDVVQDGEILKPMEFSGALDCAGIRKSMKYDLAAGPFVVQLSGAADSSVNLAVLPFE